jgi:hypothetical protein
MTKVQPAAVPAKPAAKPPVKRMYRGIVTATALCDVFVRSTSEAEANTAIAAGKGQRKKPRSSAWELWQGAIAVDSYIASEIPAPRSVGLTAQELGKVYVQVLHNISVPRATDIYSDSERQAMADAVRELYDRLSEAIHAKMRSRT